MRIYLCRLNGFTTGRYPSSTHPLLSFSIIHYKAAQNHGLLVATPYIESTVFFFAAMEKCCQAQLLADASGTKPILIDEDEAADTYATIGSHRGGWFAGLPEFEVLEAKEGVRFEYKKQ